MAAIDKIYGTCDEWVQLYVFLKKENPKHIRYLYDCPYRSRKGGGPISNFPVEVDKWLLKNCPLPFVIKSIKKQYIKESLDEFMKEEK